MVSHFEAFSENAVGFHWSYVIVYCNLSYFASFLVFCQHGSSSVVSIDPLEFSPVAILELFNVLKEILPVTLLGRLFSKSITFLWT